jgi:SAM-dependent methyltransferase
VHYSRGRLPYPPELADSLERTLGLHGTGRLLDVGCGPGSLIHLLAPLVAEAVGIDADGHMVREAERNAAPNERFVCMRAEELPADLGLFDVVAFAQSFHWLERQQVAATVRAMLTRDGAVVHVGATTHMGDGDVPRAEIDELVRAYLGPVRRAGRGALPDGTPWNEAEAFTAAGFHGPTRVEIAAGQVYARTEDEVVASVFSMSYAAPHLFGDRLGEFEGDLRLLLRRASTSGRFTERPRPMTLRIWRS